MELEMVTIEVPSADGVHTLKGRVYLPDGEPKGFLQVVHGMAEHIARYERFMRNMAREGYICFGHDHLGHGYTAAGPEEYGFIAAKGGWELLLKDVAAFQQAVRAKYGSRELPYYLMGHSMGSFVVRLAAAGYVQPDRLVVMGTGGTNPAAGMGIALAGLIKKLYGPRHVSKLINSLSFGSFNSHFGGGTAADPMPWLTCDSVHRQKYYDDPMCGFDFTVSAMGDLIRLMKGANDTTWFTSLPKGMPVLLVSGEDDPVGGYGKGVTQVRDRLQAAGVPVTMHLYPGARHEILNDITYEQVKEDIRLFLS